MKYWRGYLIGGIIALIAFGINLLAAKYTTLVDMFYPYVTRTAQNFLTDWSSGVSFCLWQVALIVLLVLVMVSIVLMIVLRWNPIQWFGWVLTVVAVIFFAHTCIYGLNNHAGPIAKDIRLNVTDYTLLELENSTIYYRDLANQYADQVSRDGDGTLLYPDFEELANAAGDGFKSLTYEHSYSVFAGSRKPVKKLGWSGLYSSIGTTGITAGLTGEAAVNPDIPQLGLPFAMCHEMSHRMCIANDRDADFAAYLACMANDRVEFRYSACFMAYRYCYSALAAHSSEDAAKAAKRITEGMNDNLKHDLAEYNRFFDDNLDEDNSSMASSFNDAYLKISARENSPEAYSEVADLLVSWHIQEVVIPAQQEEAESVFDPYDESQVDLTDIVGAMNNAPTEPVEDDIMVEEEATEEETTDKEAEEEN